MSKREPLFWCVCYCAPSTLRCLHLSTVADAMSQRKSRHVSHAGDTGTNTWVRICLNSVDRMQFLLSQLCRFSGFRITLWIWPQECYVKLHFIDFTFAFKLLSERLELGLPPSMRQWIRNFTEGESWSQLLRRISAGLLSQVLYCKRGLIFTKTSARIRVNKVSCY